MAAKPPGPSAQEIYRLIQEIAYSKAQARDYAYPGVELQDWLEAEKEVWQRLEREGRVKPTA